MKAIGYRGGKAAHAKCHDERSLSADWRAYGMPGMVETLYRDEDRVPRKRCALCGGWLWIEPKEPA